MAKEATYYGTGRRKSSVARVFITPGTGNMTINGRSLDDYFGLETLKVIVNQPIVLTGTTGQYDYKITVRRHNRPGRRNPSRHLPCPHRGRRGPSSRSQKGRFPDP